MRAERHLNVLRAMVVASSFAACSASAAVVPDDARESRWAAEVVPQVVVGDVVWLATPHRDRVLAIHAQATPSKGAIVVVHGAGVHPDWNLIGELRGALVDRGFTTLSVQMPVLAANADSAQYAALHPLAAERLEAAIAWLRAHGEMRVAIVSHSMGSAMVNAWLAQPRRARIAAWVPIGLPRPFASPLRMPVLDVVAERDFEDVRALAGRRARQLPHDDCSATVTISDTDHFLSRAVPRAVERIAPFLDAVFAGRC